MTQPFSGETMACALCDRQQKSDPNVNSDWRYIQLDGYGYYVCPKHFPPDSAGVGEFEKSYAAVLRDLFKLRAANESVAGPASVLPVLAVMKTNVRAPFFTEVFGRLDNIPIKGWLPISAEVPGITGPQSVYILDLGRITPDERARLVQNLARRFGDTTDVVAKELDQRSVPILAQGTIVAIPLRLF